MPVSRVLVAALAAGLLLSACTSEELPELGIASVEAGEVAQTVAAPARIDAVARATVSAPVGGEVDALLVSDGDVVAAGDPLVQLASDSLAEQVAQAEQAVDSVAGLSEASAGAGFDLSPLLAAFRGQLDTLIPSLLDALGTQLDTTEAALEVAAGGVEETSRAVDELRRGARDAVDGLEETRQRLDEFGDGLDGLEDLEGVDGIEGLDGLELPDLPEVEVPDLGLDDLPDGSTVTGAIGDARAATEDARAQLASTERSLRDASAQLLEAERELAAQASATEAAQLAAVEAQLEQAELALEATRARLDDLLVLAPIDGVVELARGSSAEGDGTGLPAELGDLAAGLDEIPDDLGTSDLSGLLGGAGAGTSATTSGPISEGSEVGTGQELLQVFDLSGFTAELEVDEIDVVEVEVGQPVVVRVDAFPGQELTGRVEHIALAPSRDIIGGALYPVTVSLDPVPDDIRLRVGLTASAEIEVRRLESDTVVPTSALLRRGDDEVVHVVRDGIAVEVPVRILAIGDETAAVQGDVAAGEQVVTTGVELVQDGDEVPT